MSTFLAHYNIPGSHWYHRRWQNEDGSLTEAGKLRYYGHGDTGGRLSKAGEKRRSNARKQAAKTFTTARIAAVASANPDARESLTNQIVKSTKASNDTQKAYDRLWDKAEKFLKKHPMDREFTKEDFTYNPTEFMDHMNRKGGDGNFQRALTSYEKHHDKYVASVKEMTDTVLKNIGETRLYDFVETGHKDLSVYDNQVRALIGGRNGTIPNLTSLEYLRNMGRF